MPALYPPDPESMRMAQLMSTRRANPPRGSVIAITGLMLVAGLGWVIWRTREVTEEEEGGIQAAPPSKTSQGMGMWGDCVGFKVVDQEKWDTYRQSFQPSVEIAPANAEQILVELFSSAFPECSWPPAATVRINGLTWQQQVANYQATLQG